MLELRQTAETYALGADRRDPALWTAVMADDIVISGPGFSIEGRDANLGSLTMLGQMFRATRHLVHAVHAVVDGDAATGETTCTAEHLLRDQNAILVWAIRYQDQWARHDGVWRFTRRDLILDWEETRPVKPAA